MTTTTPTTVKRRSKPLKGTDVPGSKRCYIARCVHNDHETVVTFPAIPGLTVRVRKDGDLSYQVTEAIRAHFNLFHWASFNVEYIDVN